MRRGTRRDVPGSTSNETGDSMTQQGSAQGSSGRALALARRKAMSSAGKAAVKPAPATATSRSNAPAARAATTGVAKSGAASGRAASLARRKAMSSRGKLAVQSADRVRADERSQAPAAVVAKSPAPAETAPKTEGCDCGCKGGREKAAPAATVRPNGQNRVRAVRRPSVSANPGRAASVARRRAQSSRGKAGVSASGMTAVQTARATNPDLSGRELARALREQRSKRGNAGQKKSEPCGRQRPQRGAPAAARDASWKVGASETVHGQTVTGTMVGRSRAVTGDESSTCRTVTGTEYMGADIFRDFCQSEPGKGVGVRRVGVSPTARGNSVTGNRVGRSTKVTGDEPGTCKKVTGNEYVGADQSEAFCGVRSEAGPSKNTRSETRKGKGVTGNNVGRSEKVTGDEVGAQRTLTGTQYMQSGEQSRAPKKVGLSNTLRGGAVTGTLVGRRDRMTGDEPGACRDITGDDYIGQEQYRQFCGTAPAPRDFKSGMSKTLIGETVTGTLTGRSGRVTGDEPGTCKAITGTPYAGAEQYQGYCEPDQAQAASARMRRSQRAAGAAMTGLQPAIGGKMTGDAKGACETISGTPYVGSDQLAAACPATAAEPGSPDFPQALGATPWTRFSVTPPMHAAEAPQAVGGVTGSRYEQGQITGPFGMATGKVTGTEEARFGRPRATRLEAPAEAPLLDGRVKSRITGEGIDAGPKITGDDWDLGDRVTGTEGTSAMVRNQTRRGGPMSAMAPLRAGARNEQLPEPVSKVTGGSGNTDKGALITYSGGARG